MVAGDDDVHSHVELLPFDEQWPVDVGRNDRFICLRYPVRTLNHFDASATAGIGWLDDEEPGLVTRN